MDKKVLNKMKKVTNEVLEAGKRFHKVFGTTYSSGVIGELLVTQRILQNYGKELCSGDDNDIDFKGNNIQKLDIILTLRGKTSKINAKATTVPDKHGKPRWVHQKANKFVEYKKNKNGLFIITKKREYENGLFYVYVDIRKWLDGKKPDFYVLSDKEVTQKGTTRFIKLQSGKYKHKYTDMWIEYEHIKKFKDNQLKRFKKI